MLVPLAITPLCENAIQDTIQDLVTKIQSRSLSRAFGSPRLTYGVLDIELTDD